MDNLNRRQFLGSTAVVAGTAAIGTAGGSANEKVGVAVLGCGRGSTLASWFAKLSESQVVAVCDPDQNRAGPACGLAKSGLRAPTLWNQLAGIDQCRTRRPDSFGDDEMNLAAFFLLIDANRGEISATRSIGDAGGQFGSFDQRRQAIAGTGGCESHRL